MTENQRKNLQSTLDESSSIDGLKRMGWIEKLRKHYCIASVGNSTLMHQSGQGRNNAAQQFLLNEFPLIGLATLDERKFHALLDTRTSLLADRLPTPNSNVPNWGAARKVINIYLRLCAMNKDIHQHCALGSIESYFEVPLDNHIVARIDHYAKTKYKEQFKIKNLTKEVSDEIQETASGLATSFNLKRYELDILFWNHKKFGEI
jgi:hypothetical protein